MHKHMETFHANNSNKLAMVVFMSTDSFVKEMFSFPDKKCC